MRRAAVVALMVAACGRIGFDAPRTDAQPIARPCGGGTIAPDPVTITGHTYRYTTFGNVRQAIPNVAVSALDRQGTIVTQTTSDALGNYLLSISTGGVAPSLSLRYADGADFTTTVFLDAPVDRAITAPNAAWFTAGDGPLWSGGAMASIYSTEALTLDPMKGSVTVETHDCAGNPLDGVTITVTPSPQVLGYTGTNGLPDGTLTGTSLPDTLVVAYNAVPGPVHITASKPGFVFIDQDAVILAGNFNQVVDVRPVE